MALRATVAALLAVMGVGCGPRATVEVKAAPTQGKTTPGQVQLASTFRNNGLRQTLGSRIALGRDLTGDRQRPAERTARVRARGSGWRRQAELTDREVGVHPSVHSLAISGDRIVVGDPYDSSLPDEKPGAAPSNSGSAFVFVRRGEGWALEAQLKASRPLQDDYFGHSVAISADTIVVGAPSEDGTSSAAGVDGGAAALPNSGAVYVFTRTAQGWEQTARLDAPNPGEGDGFGAGVAIDGDTFVVAAPLEDSGSSGVDGTPDESAPDSGGAYVFVRDGSTWRPQAYLKGQSPRSSPRLGDFGGGESLAGRGVAISSPSRLPVARASAAA